MDKFSISVRELQQKDITLITDYWFNATDEELTAMGADKKLLPKRSEFEAMLQSQLLLPYNSKKAYALIWEYDGKAIGHCNVNPVIYGEEAFMHLHIWQPQQRHKGIALQLVALSLPYFFKKLKLRKLFCQPHAANKAANRILEKAGFIFVREYITTPGSINFEQPVKLWQATPEIIQS
jgi:RimJ/RimL family protein N-acetyltransferase